MVSPEFVRTLYRDALGRDPAPDVLASVMRDFGSGALTVPGLQSYLESLPEHFTHLVRTFFAELFQVPQPEDRVNTDAQALQRGEITPQGLYDYLASLPEATAAAAAPALALTRLSSPATAYKAVSSDFTGIAARTLGNAGSSSDGFDALIATPLAAFSADVAALSVLDDALVSMDFVFGLFDAGWYGPAADWVDAFLSDGNFILGDFDTLLG